MTQTNFASHSKALYTRLPSVESKHCFFFAYFYRDMGINKRCSWEDCERDSRIPEKWSESLNKCEKYGKKAKYAMFCGSDQAAGKCFKKEVDT